MANGQATQVPIRKTVIVGLGGTGVKSALQVKRQFHDEHGRLPDLIKICCFDTDSGMLSKAKTTDSHGNEVRLGDTELFTLSVENPWQDIEVSETIKEWAPVGKMLLQELADGSGAAQHRSSGRLALFVNADMVIQEIRRAIDQVNQYSAAQRTTQDEQFTQSPDNATNIYIVSSLAGGTGSGCFLDIAHICRDLIGRPADRRIFGVFLLPSPFYGKSGTDLIEGNAYAACKELDYWTNVVDETTEVTYGSGTTVRWGGHEPLFDHICVLDSENEDGRKVGQADIMRFIGKGITLNTLVESAGAGQDILSDITRHSASAEPWEGGKKPSCMGWGLTTLEVPMNDLMTIYTNEAIKSLTGDMLSVNQKHVDQQVKDFVSRLRLSAAQLKQDLVSDDVEFEIQPLEEPHDAEPEPKTAIRSWLDAQRKKLQGEYDDWASQAFANKLNTLNSEIDRKYDEFLEAGELATALYFFKSLENTLSTMLNKLNQESESLSQKTIEYAEKDLDKLQPSTILRRWDRDAVQDVYNKYVQTLKGEEVNHIRDSKRVTYGIKLLSFVVEDEEDPEENLNPLARTQKYVKQLFNLRNLVEDAQNLADRKSDMTPQEPDMFTSYLSREYLDEFVPELTLNDLVAQENLRDWIGLNETGEITRRLKRVVEAHFGELKDKGIADVLASMQQRDQDRFLADLKNLIEETKPFWRFDKHPNRNIEEFIILGFPFGEDRSVVDSPIARGDLWLNAEEHSWSNIANPNQIIALKYKLAVPYYALNKMKDYRGAYYNRESQADASDFTFHIHKDWVGPEALPDIFGRIHEPEEVLAEKTKYWAVAFAEPFQVTRNDESFPLIRHDNAGNYYISALPEEERQKGHKERKLAQGRVKAFEEYRNDDDLFKILKQEVESILNAKGAEALKEPLRAQQRELEESLKRLRSRPGQAAEDLRGLIEDETQGIERFVDEVEVEADI